MYLRCSYVPVSILLIIFALPSLLLQFQPIYVLFDVISADLKSLVQGHVACQNFTLPFTFWDHVNSIKYFLQ